MDAILLVLSFVCGIGAAVFAALQPMSRAAVLACAAAFIAAAAWTRLFGASPAIIGSGVAMAAALHLVRTPRPFYAGVLAGWLAGTWLALLQAQGLPLGGAAAVAVIPLSSAWLRRTRAEFAPQIVREESLLFIVVLALVAAAAPTVVDGWHAAGNLKVQGPDTARAAAIPAWALAVASAALAGGGLYSIWSRR